MNDFVVINTQNAMNQLNTGFVTYGPRIIRAVLFAIVGVILIRLLSYLFERVLGYVKFSFGLKEILQIIIQGILWVLLGIGTLQILGLGNIALTVGALAAAFSFGISQGISPTVKDLVSGLQLSSDHDFRVGDKVIVGTKDERAEGYILEMDVKKTRIIDKHGNLHVVPNSVVDENEWILLERDEATYEHMQRADVLQAIHYKINKHHK
ncbi:MAG: mechanosensitive ion channel [Candidatus Saccharibacteria bacterium]